MARSAEAAEAWSAAPTNGKVLGTLKWALKLAGVDLNPQDKSVAEFGQARGLEPVPPPQFHAAHIELPLPGVATHVLRAPDGSHLLWVEYSSEVDMQTNYLVHVAETAQPQTSTWLDPEEVAAVGDAADLPAELTTTAAESGYGLTAGGRAVALYTTWRPWEPSISAERADAFRSHAAQLLTPLARR